VWSAFLIIVVLFVLTFTYNFEEDIFSMSLIGKANDILKFSAIYFAYVVTLLESLGKSKDLYKLHKKVHKFESMCRSHNLSTSKSHNKIRKYYVKKFYVLFLMAITVEILIAVTTSSQQWYFYWIMTFVPILANRMRHLQYFYYICVIKSYISIISDELSRISRITQRRYPINHSQHRLELLRTLYGILWEISESINAFFTYSLLTNVIHEFTGAGCGYYFLYRNLDMINSNLYSFAVVCSAINPTIFLLFFISEATWVKCDAQKISTGIYKTLKHKNEIATFNVVTKLIIDSIKNILKCLIHFRFIAFRCKSNNKELKCMLAACLK
jgi:hypothetical protein